MEHRYSKRIPANLRLLLYKRGMPAASGRLKDVSRKGLFVATDFGEVGVNQIVEVEFELSDRQELPGRRLHAVVVRKSEQGLGLELEPADVEQFEALSDLYRLGDTRTDSKQTGTPSPAPLSARKHPSTMH